MSATLNNRLAVLAADIRAAHAAVRRSAEAAAEHALAAGAALIEAKMALPHGQWGTWLADNTSITARTARRYMQLAESGIKSATVAVLGIRGATESLGRHQFKTPAPGYYLHSEKPPFAAGEFSPAAWVWFAEKQDGLDFFHTVTVTSGLRIITACRPAVAELLPTLLALGDFPVQHSEFTEHRLGKNDSELLSWLVSYAAEVQP